MRAPFGLFSAPLFPPHHIETLPVPHHPGHVTDHPVDELFVRKTRETAPELGLGFPGPVFLVETRKRERNMRGSRGRDLHLPAAGLGRPRQKEAARRRSSRTRTERIGGVDATTVAETRTTCAKCLALPVIVVDAPVQLRISRLLKGGHLRIR